MWFAFSAHMDTVHKKGIFGNPPVKRDNKFIYGQGVCDLTYSTCVDFEIKNPKIAVADINITLGLPVVRTSVDHGTAFDHAGKGDANEISLINAIEYGAKMR